MTNTVTVTLNRAFLDTAENSALEMPTPVKTTKAADTFELTAGQYDTVLKEAQFQAEWHDAENKRVAANIRRGGEAALKTLTEAGCPAEPKTEAKAKKEKPEPVDPATRPDPVALEKDPTKATYDTLVSAFEFFNKELFYGKLPPVMLVLHRKRQAHGYFWKDKWSQQDGEIKVSEIALNPESMGRTVKEVLSTLVHEMVHHEQHVFGKPSKSGHNVEWCEWMERIDLTPVGVGNCKGKRSGRNFTHEIVEGGAFDKAADKFLARKSTDMSWFSPGGAKFKKQDYTKVKHTCDCGCNIWGKFNPDAEEPGIDAWCGHCDSAFKPVFYV